MNKKVSVIIPTYRRQASLSKAITSLLNQSYGNLEIIVIDDNGFNDYNLSVYDLITNLQKTMIILFILRMRLIKVLQKVEISVSGLLQVTLSRSWMMMIFINLIK